MKITEFDIQINRENVLMLIDCYPTSPVYEAVLDEYEEMLEGAYKRIKPVALLEFGSTEGYDLSQYREGVTEALYNINSIGPDMGRWSAQLFEEGNYLGGMLADAMADDYLFQIDKAVQEEIMRMCKEKGCGVSNRLEAPQDIPMKIQRTAWEITHAKEEAGIGIMESMMLNPVKSSCQIYLLDESSSDYILEHDCSRCPRVDCKLRNVHRFPIIVKKDGEELVIQGQEDLSLMKTLHTQGIYLSAVCAGKGTCGKCKIQVLEGEIQLSKEDERFFSKEELEKGYRLACKAFPKGKCTISLDFNQEDEFLVVTDYEKDTQTFEVTKDGRYAVAVDIGTTTIAMQLVDLDKKEVIDVFTAINRQRAYGADVISRIEASNNGKGNELRQCILGELEKGIHALLEGKEIVPEKMVIGANTTMVHLLMGYSCETLGVFPFTPVNIDTIHIGYEELFGSREYSFEVTVFPGISTYVGGDITAGLYACDFDRKEQISVLVDLGTNGEMAVGCKDKIMVTSAAAGPAFEGGNIIHGTGSIPGAVCNVVIEDGKAVLKTIGDKEPVGICGTGVIDMTYELVKAELVDETGLLEEDYFEEGFPLTEGIAFYQKDVREIQLAKSAVRAGLETLLLKYGVTYDEIDKIYIAGGFGYKMDIVKAIGIGLLPGGCKDKIEAIGNSCLKGAVLYLTDKEAEERVGHIAELSTEVNLPGDRDFNKFYMEYMYFE